MELDGALPALSELPSEVYFRLDRLPAMEWATHSHPWGQLNYVSKGVMNLEVEGVRFLSPPQYAIWIPPFKKHFSYAVSETEYRSVYVSLEFSKCMPATACITDVSPVTRAILGDLASRNIRVPLTNEDVRMSQVVLDQIRLGKAHVAYLPYGESEYLNTILAELQKDPGDKRSIKEVAAHFNMTARTFERRCQRELGISYNEWRLRLKFMRALELLEAGQTIQRIAYELGYATTSAFIVMFKKLTGSTPDQYRLANCFGNRT
jgi:AraC-like DNA-binding protein